MQLLYAKRFSKDIDAIQNDSEVKKNLLETIERLKHAESLTELNGVRKMEGYSQYYRIKIGEYRLGIKLNNNVLELIRFLHRKDIYRRFP
jgi:mRNA interferase RelE/StbE